jgi:hypothetical protein
MKWDKDKIRKLKSFRNNGMTYKHIAKKLNTTEYSVMMKMRRLGKEGKIQLQEHIFDDNFTFEHVDKDTLLKSIIIWLCEGTSYIPNGKRNRVEIVNSDPRIIYLFVNFLRRLGANEKKIKLRLKVSEKEEIKAKRFWSKLLKIPYISFGASIRPTGLKTKKKTKYGTLTVKYNSKKLALELCKISETIMKIK